tara:strand:- start:353 stop:637 length:285 start_codon:yes stop_codon:yes gene_type:complete
MYKIEKDIPVPPARTNISKADSKLKDILKTLRELEIDHCFLIPMSVDELKDKREVNVLRSKIAYAKRILKHREKTNIQLTSREEKLGLRVWRIR